MGIRDEIFEDFLKKLKEDKEFPNTIIEELKRLFEREEIVSREKILDAIKKGCENVSTD